MHPVSDGEVAGYAFCAQYDQFGRCTVGYVNLAPDEVSSTASRFDPKVMMEERAVLLHEVLHVAGCCKDSDLFRDAATGRELSDAGKWLIEDDSPFLTKRITKWATPGVS
jgi:hypothetical protein